MTVNGILANCLVRKIKATGMMELCTPLNDGRK